MKLKDLCLNCMSETGNKSACPHCGWHEGMAPEAAVYLRPGSILHEKYCVGRVLGHGGFGITYLGWDINLETRIAIKEYLPRDLASRAQDRSTVVPYSGEAGGCFEYGLEKFVEEARALARLADHPGVIIVRDYFRENGTAYLIMVYLTGRTLKEYLKEKGGKLPSETAMAIMMAVMDTVREIHGSGMIHRDISPDNIYLTSTGQVKILDFGAARHAVGEYSKSLSVILKPGYAPEEQYRSRGNQGPWTDVYAVAATLYHAITGVIPAESLDRMAEDTLEPPSKLGFRLPPQAEAALMKALAIRAKERFQSIREFQEALKPQAAPAPASPAAPQPGITEPPKVEITPPPPAPLRPEPKAVGPLKVAVPVHPAPPQPQPMEAVSPPAGSEPEQEKRPQPEDEAGRPRYTMITFAMQALLLIAAGVFLWALY